MKHIIRVISLVIIVLSVLLLSGCTDDESTEKSDTVEKIYNVSSGKLQITLSVPDEVDNTTLDNADDYDYDVVKEFDIASQKYENAYTFLTTDNPAIADVNSDTDAIFDCDKKLYSVISEVFAISEKTFGAVSPVKGYDNTVITLENGNVLKSDRSAKLDFSDVIGGYAIKEASEYLKNEAKLTHFYITNGYISGFFGSKSDGSAYNIALTNGDVTFAFLSVTDGYIASVTEGENAQENLENTEFSKVFVYTSDAVSADALAHAVYSLGSEKAFELYDNYGVRFEAVMIKKDGTVEITDGLRDSSLYIPYESLKDETK